MPRALGTTALALAACALLWPGSAAAKGELDFGGREIKVNLSDPPKAALLFDLERGDVLWSRKPGNRRPIASLTKVMTALVAAGKLDARDKVRVTREAAGQPPVDIGLEAGSRLRAETLFAATLIPSANDAAVALAGGAGGSHKRFVKLMNDRARKLDLGCTRFRSASGLSSHDVSCPEDLGELTIEALEERRIAKLVRKRGEKLRIPGRGRVRTVSTNPLHRERYPGTVGVKTGFTNAAGRCLIAAVKDKGTTLVAVLLDSPDTGAQAKKLIKKGFKEDRRR